MSKEDMIILLEEAILDNQEMGYICYEEVLNRLVAYGIVKITQEEICQTN